MRVSVYYAGGGSPVSAGPPTCSAARGPQKVLLQKEIRRVMIHSFRKHGASPTAPARAPLTPRCIRMVPGPPANAPPPLRQTHPLAPSSCAPHSPRQSSRDSSSLWEGTCGTNKERGWAKVKARRDLGGARGGLGGCGAAGKERGARRRGWVR